MDFGNRIGETYAVDSGENTVVGCTYEFLANNTRKESRRSAGIARDENKSNETATLFRKFRAIEFSYGIASK